MKMTAGKLYNEIGARLDNDGYIPIKRAVELVDAAKDLYNRKKLNIYEYMEVVADLRRYSQ